MPQNWEGNTRIGVSFFKNTYFKGHLRVTALESKTQTAEGWNLSIIMLLLNNAKIMLLLCNAKIKTKVEL